MCDRCITPRKMACRPSEVMGAAAAGVADAACVRSAMGAAGVAAVGATLGVADGVGADEAGVGAGVGAGAGSTRVAPALR